MGSRHLVEALPDVVRYDTPEAVMQATFPDVDMEHALWGGEDEDGNETEGVPAAKVATSIRVQQVWGFCDAEGRIHVWADPACPVERLVHFYAHELSHARLDIGVPDDEEARAEAVGRIARDAYTLALRHAAP